MSTKTIGVVVVIIVLGAGGYYFMSSRETMPATQQLQENTQPTAQNTSAGQTTGSVDDFTAGIDAELQAQTAAVGAYDADTDASVSAIQTSGDSSQLYDPKNI